MHSLSYAALFAATVAAQSTVTLLNIFPFEDNTVTQIGSDATATTYKNACTGGDGISILPSPLRMPNCSTHYQTPKPNISQAPIPQQP